MPSTPFHFGPGLALHAAAPRQVNFLAFCAANALIDVETLYNLATGHHALHTFFHTYVGATLVAGVITLAFTLVDRWGGRAPTLAPVITGAALGAYSHILLDSVMHADVRPFAPFSMANPLLDVLSTADLHLLCVALGMAGLLGIALRWIITRRAMSVDL